MPASKKTLRTQEAKKKEAAGTKVLTNAGGIPKKPEKPKTQCQICKGEFIATMPTVLRDHASNKHVKNTFEQCFPNIKAKKLPTVTSNDSTSSYDSETTRTCKVDIPCGCLPAQQYDTIGIYACFFALVAILFYFMATGIKPGSLVAQYMIEVFSP